MLKSSASCVVVLIWALTFAGAAAADTCDPYQDQLDQAVKARIAKNYQASLDITQQVLRVHPNDFRATYTTGLILIDQSGLGEPSFVGPALSNASFKRGIALLVEAAQSLRLSLACADAEGWWSIYSTLGWEFFVAGDLQDAKTNVEVAYAHWDVLPNPTRLHLARNAVQIYTALGDAKKAAQFNALLLKTGGPTYQVAATLNAAQIEDTKPLLDIRYSDPTSATVMVDLQGVLQGEGFNATYPQLVGKISAILTAKPTEEITFNAGNADQQAQAKKLISLTNAYFMRACLVLPQIKQHATHQVGANLELWFGGKCGRQK